MKFSGYIKFREDLLFRRVYLRDQSAGEVVRQKKDEHLAVPTP